MELFSHFQYVRLLREIEQGVDLGGLVIMGHFKETPEMLRRRYEHRLSETPTYDETSFKELGFVPAILLITRASLTKQDAETVVDSFFDPQLHMDNDVYKTFVASGKPETGFSRCNLNLIYPASQTHIEKYSPSYSILIEETAEEYRHVTQPYILRLSPDRLKWIHNLFSHKTADPCLFKERILFDNEDPLNGFILATDYKWNEKDLNELYCLAIPRRIDLRSIRDLTVEHVPFLKSMRERILLVLHQTYRVEANQLRLYFHYQPTYYHLHLHCVHVNVKLNSGFFVDKAHFLKDVIENLEFFDSDYYKRKTISYMLSSSSELYEQLMKYRHP
jgi:m7GpppX diphosphatase